MYDEMTRGEKVSILSKKKGWDAQRLANEVGVTRSYVYKIESDNCGDISPEVLQRLCTALGCEIEFLMDLSLKARVDEPELLEFYSPSVRQYLQDLKNKPYVLFGKHLHTLGDALFTMDDEEKLNLLKSLEALIIMERDIQNEKKDDKEDYELKQMSV